MAKTSMIVKLTAQDGKRDDLLAALNKMLGAVNEEPGTEIYAFNLDTTDENAIWIYELYTDEDALATHTGSDAMADADRRPRWPARRRAADGDDDSRVGQGHRALISMAV